MLKRQIGDWEINFVFWVFVHLIVGLVFRMRNSSNSDGQKSQNRVVSRSAKSPFRAISSYLRIVSSGASTVARSAASMASSIVERIDDSSHDQVLWAGFDKLEGEGDVTRQVLLLGYRSGFQVWDVEEADNVCDLVSRYDGPVSFLQMLPKPVTSERSRDKYAEVRPLLVTCSDGSFSGGTNIQDGLSTHGTIPNYRDSSNGSFEPSVVRFYSLKSQSYVHVLKFRSIIYSVRSSSRVVAICQAAQIHCFDAATLEREYSILTNPIGTGYPTTGGIGIGPLAVGPRWLAYSGSPVVVSNSGRVSPQHLSPSLSFSGLASNGSRVAHYAKVSSKQLATGIVTLGDMGYKKLSRYYSEILSDSQNSLQSAIPGGKGNGTVNGLLPDADNVGMVIVRDIVSKGVIAQFRAHKSPIAALCFDPSGVLLVTASVQGHNINVFKIMPGLQGSSSACVVGKPYVHLYRLQRGITNAVIQDISFSNDSNWIMISSSRGTSHLFAINPLGGSAYFQSADTSFTAKYNGSGFMTKPGVRWPPNSGVHLHNQHSLCASGSPVTLSVVSRLRNGNNGWRGHVSGAAAAATGRMSPLSGAIASSFHNCKGNGEVYADVYSKMKYYLLVFSPSGCMIQYALRVSAGLDVMRGVSGLGTAFDSVPDSDAGLVVEAIQKWNICQKQSRREREDNLDIYGENGALDSNKIYPEEINERTCLITDARVAVEKKVNLGDKHHMYISEAELQMHPPRIPLWAKPEIYFQLMTMEGIEVEDELKGEVEIEKISTRVIEARSKHLIPVSDYLQSPKPQAARVPGVDNNTIGQLVHQRSGLSEKGRHSCISSSVSLESVTDSVASVPDHSSDTGENGCDGPQMPVETKGNVNNSDMFKINMRLGTVNNSESLRMEAQHKFVNNSIEGLKMENHFEDEGDEFD